MRYFFCGSFVLIMPCVRHAFASVQCCLVVTCWERADLLTLVCNVLLKLIRMTSLTILDMQTKHQWINCKISLQEFTLQVLTYAEVYANSYRYIYFYNYLIGESGHV